MKSTLFRVVLFRAVLCSAAIIWTTEAFAQGKGAPLADRSLKAAARPQKNATMDGVQLAMLIKSTIIALQHANQTGNYSVLRDLGTPLFRERFDQVKLSAIFSGLRGRGVNLSPILVLSPNLTRQPELKDKQLRLMGNFPTQPLQIKYELVFQQIDSVWRVDGVSVEAVAVQTTQAGQNRGAPSLAAQTPAPGRPSASAKSGKRPVRQQN
ncbi:hypothetical protein KKP04_01935 [Rhodomicrobium sp. Az07]|uniref:hypothetical protein n=1 Tax=Rhodomicrobium sp. Az07 TaxID=2839034 RepID=UPI001BE99141|nr:hypothetical protein [Rhodomicrobium sp. Az07]MBT3069631.1 hypothetical protein [Rhodomicrobium sp. Az07]